MNCRICEKKIVEATLNLGSHPLANFLLEAKRRARNYPIEFYYCDSCQTGLLPKNPDIKLFDPNYPFYSSINRPYVLQCKQWVDFIASRLKPYESRILEIACNDGYLLQFFYKKGFKHVYGVEPVEKIARHARKFANVAYAPFNEDFADHYETPFDLIIANNVIAHVDNVRGFFKGVKKILSKRGIFSIEVQHIQNLIKNAMFDNIYHEHLSYYSIKGLVALGRTCGLELMRVDEIPSQGGSVRAYFTHKEMLPPALAFNESIEIQSFKDKVSQSIETTFKIINKLKQDGKKVCGFGAAAKGISRINYCGLSSYHIDSCFDSTPAKWGKFMPGSNIPILPVEKLREVRPDVLWILPFDFRDSMIAQTSIIKEWGGEHLCLSI